MSYASILHITEPETIKAPFVIDSPHSGTIYPDDFRHDCARGDLERAEDRYVDALFFAAAAACQIPMVQALFPRTYIDVNRAVDDIDEKLIDGKWPTPLCPTMRSQQGTGLIRRVVRPNSTEQVYHRKLGVADICHRIDNYYKPYHRALQETLDRVYAIYQRVYLLDCHSMPSTGHHGLADIVLGNRDDTSCTRDFMTIVGDAFTARGYSVAYNHPYKGVEIVRKFSSPREHRYALQIEINRALYMNETTLEKTSGFDTLRTDLEPVLRQIIDYSYVK